MATRDFVVAQRERDKHQPDFDSIMSLPISLHEAYRLHLSNTKHPAVNMFSSSLQAHRSCNEAILFLYGVSGAGKSSTLNHLFSADIIPTSATESATDSVIEWVSTMHSEHWHVSNLEVGFVDVPGWGDSEGRDATHFALMQQFLSVHPILGSKVRKFYPNIVLIVFNSNDNRMLGTEASATKMLNALSKLDIVDKNRPNVVIVLTHVCSLSSSEFTEKLSAQSNIYKSIARSTLGVEPPVVWMENNPSYELKKDGDWTLLYDGTAQPLNLYEAMRDLMVSAGDELGKEALRLYFDKRVDSLPKERLIVNAKLCNKKILSSREREWGNSIKKKQPSYKRTSLNTYLHDYIASHPALAIQQQEVTGLLLTLASCLPDKSDIKSKEIGYLESKVHPYLMSAKEKQLLTQALELDLPEMPCCIMVVGRGYDMIKGTITDGQLVEITQSDSFCSFLNRPLSNAFSLLPFEGNRITFGSYNTHNRDNLSELEQSRSHLLDVVSVSPEEFSNVMNRVIIEIDKDIESCIDEGKRYLWIESGIFSVELNFSWITLCREICDAIEALPENPINENGEINSEYAQFLNHYGHSVIIKANGGGIIEGDIKMTYHSEKELVDEVQPCLEMLFDLIKDGKNWRDFRQKFSKDQISIFKELDSTCIQWLGGNKIFTSKTIKNIKTDTYQNWLNSLKQSSILFDYSFSFIPIHLLVATKYPIIAERLKQAIDTILPDTDSKLFYDESSCYLAAIGSEIDKPTVPCSSVAESNVTPVHRALLRLNSKKNVDKNVDTSDTEHATTRYKVFISKILPSKAFNVAPSRPRTRSDVAEKDKTNINQVKDNCFSLDARVLLKNGECINISEVRIGDSLLSLDIKTNLPVYSKVYMWGHMDRDATASFVKIHHEHGTLKLTDNHLLLQGHDRRLTTASRMQIGDTVHFLQSGYSTSSSYSIVASKVTRVSRCVQKGVYCPLTLNSSIVVDGLVCSVFAVPDNSVGQFDRFEKISRLAMSPFILASRLGCRDRVGLNANNKIHPYLRILLECYYSLPKVRAYISE